MSKEKKQYNFFCEIKGAKSIDRSQIIPFKDGRWRGIKSIAYKTEKGNWSLIERFPLFKSKWAKFEVRYFEIAPGGASSLEYHLHVHVVICIKGKGKIRIGKRWRNINYLDIAYIAPNEVHQLTNPFDEPFGFLCIVDSERDKPVELPF